MIGTVRLAAPLTDRDLSDHSSTRGVQPKHALLDSTPVRSFARHRAREAATVPIARA